MNLCWIRISKHYSIWLNLIIWFFFFHNRYGIVDCGGAAYYGRELIVLGEFPFKFETVFKCGKRIDNFRFRCLNRRRQRDEQSEWNRTERNRTEQNRIEFWSEQSRAYGNFYWINDCGHRMTKSIEKINWLTVSIPLSLVSFYNFHHNFWLHSDHYGYWSSQDFSLENQFVGRFCFPFGSFQLVHLRHKEIIYFFFLTTKSQQNWYTFRCVGAHLKPTKKDAECHLSSHRIFCRSFFSKLNSESDLISSLPDQSIDWRAMMRDRASRLLRMNFYHFLFFLEFLWNNAVWSIERFIVWFVHTICNYRHGLQFNFCEIVNVRFKQ